MEGISSKTQCHLDALGPPPVYFGIFYDIRAKFQTRQDNRHVFTSSAWSNDCKSTVKKEIKRKV